MKNAYYIIFSIIIFISCQADTKVNKKTLDIKAPFSWLFIGTYTKKEGHVDGKAEGIYVYQMSQETGALTAIDTILGVINPSYVAVHPNGQYLYAVNELADATEKVVGKISAFKMNLATKQFEFLNGVSSEGDAPCHLSIDPSGKFVLVANYVMGTVASFAILEDGRLSEAISVQQHQRNIPEAFRQEAAHAHAILPGMQSKGIFAVDLGTDEIIHYELDSIGQLKKLATTNVEAGSGCRHLAFHPTQPWCYVLNELTKKVDVFLYQNPKTPMSHLQTLSTLDAPISTGTIFSAAIKVHPSGQFLYASNRGLNGNTEQTIVMYHIDEQAGTLTYLGKQDTKGLVPRDFEIDPSGQFLLVANQDSDSVVTFKIDKATGRLKETGLVATIKTPVCLKFYSKK